jgi:hypothetical protein
MKRVIKGSGEKFEEKFWGKLVLRRENSGESDWNFDESFR